MSSSKTLSYFFGRLSIDLQERIARKEYEFFQAMTPDEIYDLIDMRMLYLGSIIKTKRKDEICNHCKMIIMQLSSILEMMDKLELDKFRKRISSLDKSETIKLEDRNAIRGTRKRTRHPRAQFVRR